MIFPPFIGFQSGENLWFSVLGFVTTGVCLPLLGAIAGALVNGKIELLGKMVGKWFYAIFPFIIYLAIGPLFIIPRSASVTYTMGIEPLVSGNGRLIMFITTAIYFLISGYFALKPSKMVGVIGKFITPALFIVIGVIVVYTIVSPIGDVSKVTSEYMTSPYFKGFVEGFLTMDALGALVVANIIVGTIKRHGVEDKKQIIKYTTIAAIIAGTALAIIYISLAYVGSRATIFGEVQNGAVLLAYVMHYMFGKPGLIVLAIVIALASLSTSIGVTSASSNFFYSRTKKFNYNIWVMGITLVSFIISNVGLDLLIEITIPVLTIIYPEAIVIILLAFLYKYIGKTKYVYSVTVITALVISIVNTLGSLGVNIPIITNVFKYLPLYDVTLGWIVPTIVFGFATYFYEKYLIKT